jgi:hypothetical protein
MPLLFLKSIGAALLGNLKIDVILADFCYSVTETCCHFLWWLGVELSAAALPPPAPLRIKSPKVMSRICLPGGYLYS